MAETYKKELLLELWEKMHLARNFEERVQWLFSMGLVHGTTHLGIGEEATAAGTVLALKPQDYVYGTHRGHNQGLCKGVNPDQMMAEILAKATGVCKGKGGSMHIADPSIYYFGADGILGASAVMCCGSALAIKKRKEPDRIALVLFGDGTFNEGAMFEAMNLAAAWKLPVLFVCVNNTYGMSTHISRVTNDTDLSKRAIPFGMPSYSIDGNNVLEVYDTITKARAQVLEGTPVLVVENTYRISGHSKSDGNLYRTKEEIAEWKEKCPIKQFRAYLLAKKRFTEQELDEVAQRASARIDQAVEYAKASPEPEVETMLDDVYA